MLKDFSTSLNFVLAMQVNLITACKATTEQMINSAAVISTVNIFFINRIIPFRLKVDSKDFVDLSSKRMLQFVINDLLNLVTKFL